MSANIYYCSANFCASIDDEGYMAEVLKCLTCVNVFYPCCFFWLLFIFLCQCISLLPKHSYWHCCHQTSSLYPKLLHFLDLVRPFPCNGILQWTMCLFIFLCHLVLFWHISLFLFTGHSSFTGSDIATGLVLRLSHHYFYLLFLAWAAHPHIAW